MPIHIGRWHIEYHKRAIYITREPNPNCPNCNGSRGGWIAYGTDADWDECACLAQLRNWRIPLWPSTNRAYTEEPL
ncbi:hypothetical protein ACIQ7D_18095 [Streptomyces sp. NPDC096310]|uniref:hypothetical protein n=1 Tax=Streptomyces sp. NPDC096310 TaxID=3366082 RepID=UPI0037FDF36C